MLTQKCIWMECGFVEYKLCERNYDCENCPFDIAIKKARELNMTEEKKLNSLPSDSNKIITPDHIWILKESDIYTFGLDDFAQMFFDHNCSIAFPEVGSSLYEGRTFLWIIGSFGAIGFRSPIDGNVIWINSEIKKNPQKFFEKNSLDIDLIKVKGEHEIQLNQVYKFDDRHNLHNSDKYLIKEFLLKKFTDSKSTITLPDGGEFRKEILNELSNIDYLKLLRILFNKKNKERSS